MRQDTEYRFYIHELNNCSTNDIGFIIELMRSAEHIKEFGNILHGRHFLKESAEEMEESFHVESGNNLLLNMMVAQLRESLKLFFEFKKTLLFSKFYNSLSDNELVIIDQLIEAVQEFHNKKGIIYKILKPHRDRVFHYDPKKTYDWILEIEKHEKIEHPYIQSFDLEKNDFNMGVEYDTFIFVEALANKPSSPEKLEVIEGKNRVFELQDFYVSFVEFFGDFLMSSNNIEKGRNIFPMHRFMRERDLEKLENFSDSGFVSTRDKSNF